jgi:hypothetical protein
MSVTITFERLNGTVSATVAGIPNLRAEGPSEEAAAEALREQLRASLARRTVGFLDVDAVGLSGLAGTYRNDPTLQDICGEAYRMRDEQRDAEWADAPRD